MGTGPGLHRRAPALSSPLPLWERVDRTAKRFETGEGAKSSEPSNPSSVADFVRATFSHKGRRDDGAVTALLAGTLTNHAACARSGVFAATIVTVKFECSAERLSEGLLS